MADLADPVTNVMSVDVEDYFQVSAFESLVDRSDWESHESRIERNMDRVLALFDEHGVKATFFTLGWIAERYPDTVRRIVAEGHELASHGWAHFRVTTQDAASFREDVIRTKHVLEDTAGVPVIGYRAASYSINESTPWAHEVLEETGHSYSSSIFPIRHDHYGVPDAPRFAYRPGPGALVEFPMTTFALRGRKFPCAGGGWFRLVPYHLMRAAMRRVNRVDGESVIFYFHPWEIDPGQPRMPGAGPKTRFRHYLNLGRTEGRLRSLLSDFNWGRLDRTLFLPGRGEN